MMPPGLERLESVLESAEAAVVPHIMSEQEIMHKYRKISTSVRIARRLFTSSYRLSKKILFTFKRKVNPRNLGKAMYPAEI